MPEIHFVTITEGAGRLRLAPKTIRNQLCAGTFPIPSHKVGWLRMFRSDDLEAFIRNPAAPVFPSVLEGAAASVQPMPTPKCGRPRKVAPVQQEVDAPTN